MEIVVHSKKFLFQQKFQKKGMVPIPGLSMGHICQSHLIT